MLIESLLLGLGIITLMILIAIFFVSKGFLREIFKSENYVKFIQLVLVGVLLIVFLSMLIYFWLNDAETTKMDVIFTVVVGWLGLIIGAFFGQKFMEGLTEEEESSRDMIEIMDDYEERMEDLIEVINDYEKQTNQLKK